MSTELNIDDFNKNFEEYKKQHKDFSENIIYEHCHLRNPRLIIADIKVKMKFDNKKCKDDYYFKSATSDDFTLGIDFQITPPDNTYEIIKN